MLERVEFPITWETINAYAAGCSPRYLARGVKFIKNCRFTKEKEGFSVNNTLFFYKDKIKLDTYSDHKSKIVRSYTDCLKIFKSSPLMCFSSTQKEEIYILTLNNKIVYNKDTFTYDGNIINYNHEERENSFNLYKKYFVSKKLINYFYTLRRFETHKYGPYEVFAGKGLIHSLETIETYLNTSYLKGTKKDFMSFMRLMLPTWETRIGLSPMLTTRKKDLPSLFSYALKYIKENS